MTYRLYLSKVTGMTDSKASVWKKSTAQQFAEVLAGIDDLRAMENFLRDVMTEKEIIEISSRLEAARLLEQGSTYSEVVSRTRLSSRTVARISAWMQDGCDGYAAALRDINHKHTSPARAG